LGVAPHARCIALHLNALLDSHVAVLTASRRLAHALRAGYARHAQAQGRVAWDTPQVLPWTAWLREQWREARAQNVAPVRSLLSRAQSRALWRSVVASSDSGANLLSPANAARLAERSWRRLHEYEIPIDALLASDQPESRALHEWCAAYVRRCETLGALDEAQLASWAAQAPFTPERPIALAGFDHTPPALGRLVRAWRAAGKFAEIALRDERASVHVVPARDSAAEIESAARWARATVEEREGSVGVLVAGLTRRQDEVRRAFEDVFSPGARCVASEAAPAPIAIAAARPLLEYPIVDAAFAVLQLAEHGDGVLFGRVLRSPFVAGGVSERDLRALADFRMREEQRGEWSWFEVEHWGGALEAAVLLRIARDLCAILRNEQSATAPSRWAERFQAMLQAAGWPGERALGSAEQQTLEKFRSALAEFGALDAVLARLSLRDALGQLRSVLSDISFEPESPSASVTIIDPATAAGMSFDALWVAGLDAERWPAAANPDPLIPVRLQRSAGMPEASAEGMRALAERQLDRWLRSARRIVWSWPLHEGDAELEPSPLLSPWTAAPVATGAAVRSLRRTLFEHRPTLERTLDVRAPALAPGAARGGARPLELQSQCPFRAQAELRLYAKEIPRISIGVEPRARGRILHSVLEEVWRKLQDHATLTATDRTQLGLEVRAIAERVTASVVQVATGHRARLARLEIDSVTRQVLELLELERTRPPFRVRFAEASQSFQIGGLAITLRPDRVDELATHGALLIDYKLGDTHKASDWLDKLPGRPKSPQLPLYALAHEPSLDALAFVTLAPGAVEYRGWSRSGAVGAGVPVYPAKIPKRLDPPADWAALLAHWRTTLTQLARRYVAGEAAVDPLPQACTYCPLSTLCRIHEHTEARSDDE
jgi:ATP-dependent helicase/nuclease subunit B